MHVIDINTKHVQAKTQILTNSHITMLWAELANIAKKIAARNFLLVLRNATQEFSRNSSN